jgi:benzoyl-CoA reductase subunit C
MKPVETLMDNAWDPHGWMREEGDSSVVGYFCSYVPEELIHAAGLVPTRLLRGPEPGPMAGRFMQTFCCSFARSVFEAMTDGTCDYLSAVVMPHTCDTARNMSDLIGVARPALTVLPLMVPTVTHTPEAVDFMVEELEVLKADLEPLASTEITDEKMWEAIRLYNRCRRKLVDLGSYNLDAPELFAAHLAFQSMGKEEFLRTAESIEPRGEERAGVKIALSGGPVPDTRIFSTLSDCGLRVVWDDLCTASRNAAGEVGEDGEPIRRLAERYMGRIPCPTKSDPGQRRLESLVEGVNGAGAQGVIFLVQNFCEFHAFDYPAFESRLTEEGISSMRLELEYPFEPSGREMTRIQAFAETLTGKAD